MTKKKKASLKDFLNKHIIDIPVAYWSKKLQPALNPKGPLGSVVRRKKLEEQLKNNFSKRRR